MTVNASVQFDSFVDFAQKSMTAGSSKAVARADTVIPGVDGGFAARTIVAAPDKAFKLSRSITDKAKNDVARTLFQKSVIEMFGGSFASEMKNIATDSGGLFFDKDIVRGMRITLPDGTRVANDPAAARDQLAQLVTGNSHATFATLSPTDRTKTNMFVALLMQQTETSLERGVPMSLTHVRDNMAYTPVAGGDMLPTRAFHISGSPSEGFTIHHQGTYPAVLLMYDDEKGDSQTLMMQDGKRVNCSYEMEIRISAAHWDNGRPS